MTNLSMVLSYTWMAAFATRVTGTTGIFSAADGNGNIHLMGDPGGNSSNYNRHYQYGAGVWSILPNIPVPFSGGCAITDTDGNVTLFVPKYYSSNRCSVAQYRYIDGAWVEKTSIPAYPNFVSGERAPIYAAFAPDGTINVIFDNLGDGTSTYPARKSHFVCNTDETWSEVGTAPGVGPIAVDKNGNVHMFVYTYTSTGGTVTHYVYSEGAWSSMDTFAGTVSCAFADTNGTINIFQGNNQFKYVAGELKLVGQIAEVTPSNAFVAGGELAAVGTTTSTPYTAKLYKASGAFMPA